MTLEQLEHLRRVRAAAHRASWPRWPAARARGASGSIASSALAPRVLRMPAYVLRVLADLRPMADVGPVDLDEVRRVLDRAAADARSRSRRRAASAGSSSARPQQARGRSFRVVFVPGLAERMFPQKPREDPLLLDDAARAALDARCRRSATALAAERLLLQLAAGAATERLYVSYPRIELSESRARVPSFYALDVHARRHRPRARSRDARGAARAVAGSATLAWPAPPRAGRRDRRPGARPRGAAARCSTRRIAAAVKGHAHYLLRLNECLRRSVIDRWARGRDAVVAERRPDARRRRHDAPALAAQRLTARSYSLSALQHFSACPYQFVLSAIYRLQPLEQPEPLQRLDPLTRGSIFHDIQARFFRELQARGALPVTAATLDAARAVLDDVVDDVADARARRAGAGRRARLGATRVRVDPPRPARLAATTLAQRRRRVASRGTSSSAFGPRARRARCRAAVRDAGARSRAGSRCAARSI